MTQRGDALELAILGQLESGRLHGYELRKRLMATIGVFRTLSFGSLYPRLRMLSERGLVTAEAAVGETPPARNPARSTTPRRSRIVYELTAAGRKHLAEALAAVDPSAWDDDVFDLRFSLFASTSPATRMQILEGRRARVLEQREAARRSQIKPRGQRDVYTAELQRRGLELLDRELVWLDGLIDSERSSLGIPRTFHPSQSHSSPAAPTGVPGRAAVTPTRPSH